MIGFVDASCCWLISALSSSSCLSDPKDGRFGMTGGLICEIMSEIISRTASAVGILGAKPGAGGGGGGGEYGAEGGGS